MRCGLLSTWNDPFLGYVIREFRREGSPVSAIVMDQKGLTEKQLGLVAERTGVAFQPIPLEEFEDMKIPIYAVSDHRSDSAVRLIRSLDFDLLVNAGTPRILPKTVLEAPRVGVVNCHPGLLPKFRGCTCVEWAIYLDEPVGNTVHFMAEEIDAGPIVLQEQLHFGKRDTYTDVRVKVYNHANSLLARGVKKIVAEKLHPKNLPGQTEGRYFNVIDADKMATVPEKLLKGEYAFQR